MSDYSYLHDEFPEVLSGEQLRKILISASGSVHGSSTAELFPALTATRKLADTL